MIQPLNTSDIYIYVYILLNQIDLGRYDDGSIIFGASLGLFHFLNDTLPKLQRQFQGPKMMGFGKGKSL